ncbi:MAG TPA: FliH/SctL family protein [Candidatus Baltobacteraceae bacterium]
MGKVVKGAQVARETYLLKLPRAASADAARSDIENAGFSGLDAEAQLEQHAPQVDWIAARAQAVELIDGASADAEALLRDAHSGATALVRGATASKLEIEERARAQGFEQGIADGRAAAQAEMDEMLSTMRGLVEMARAERHKIIEGAEPEIVRLATTIAERILHQHVALDPQSVLEMARAAITRLVHRETVTVRVHPADIETMRENRETMMSMNDIEHLRVIEDQRVDRGGIVIETDGGTIDAKISTQLREVRRLLHVEEPLTIAPTSKGTLLNSSAQAS